jgi:RNA polymerase sigma factor (sigma-70 family)
MVEDLNAPSIVAALQHRILSAGEERDIAVRAAAGDAAAREALVGHNLRFVAHRARAYAGRGVPLADLFQEGACGLVRAAAKFDPSRGVRFTTYAGWWIDAGLQDAIRTAQPVVLPRPVEARRRRVMAAMPAAGPDVAALAGVTPAHAEEGIAIARLQRPAAIDAAVVAFEDRTAPSVDEQASVALRRRGAEQLLSECGTVTARILRLRFGFDDDRERTYAEIAGDLGSNRETVRLAACRALARLQSSRSAGALRDAC